MEQNDEWSVQRARYMTLVTSPQSATIPSSSYPLWPDDQPGPAGDGDGYELRHHWGHYPSQAAPTTCRSVLARRIEGCQAPPQTA
jgi:hypothetical protein